MALKGPRGTYHELAGQRFGKWLVVAHIGRESETKRDHFWLCRCDCGTERNVRASEMRSGKSASCGCTQGEYAKTHPPGLKHGLARTPTYRVWCALRERCNNRNNKDYPTYGGRGISVCGRWDDFANFLADMGERPKGLTIERKDGNLGYEPGNCVWATYAQQNNNRSINVFVEHAGRRQTVSQWAHEAGMNPELVRGRLKRGWAVAKALTPIQRSPQ